MKKRNLLLSLTVPRANFVYGMALHRTTAKRPKDILEYLSHPEMVFEAPSGDRAAVTLQPLREQLLKPHGPAELLGALGTALGRALVQDTFELIVAYCGGLKADAFRKLENDKLLVFARIVRNTFSHEHGIRILRWPKRLRDRVEWRGHLIDRGDVGTVLTFGPYDYYRLHEDLMNYANEKLPEDGEDTAA